MRFQLVIAATFLFFSGFAVSNEAEKPTAPKQAKLDPPSIGFFQKARNALSFSKKGYLDLEDNQYQSVFTIPGVDWNTCEQYKECKAIGWPDNNSEIEILTPPTKVTVRDFKTNQLVEQEFVKIRYSYVRETPLDSEDKGNMKLQEGEGWIDAAYITDKKRKTFFPEAKKKYELPVCKNDQFGKNLSDIEDVAKVGSRLNVISAAVKEVTGQCVADPPRNSLNGNVYDKLIMPTILKQPVPRNEDGTEIQKETGGVLTSQDLVSIDSLARSMYGEMASCFKHGLQYPMTVAKIVQNRSVANEREREFVKPPHHPAKSSLSKVVTSSSQFNVWMPKIGERMNPSLKMALCPPSNKNGNYWNGRIPPLGERQIWDNAIKIATQVVVQGNTFATRTSQIKGFFYTSGMGRFYNMKQVFPMIEDRRVEKNACLEVWMEKEKVAERASAKTTMKSAAKSVVRGLLPVTAAKKTAKTSSTDVKATSKSASKTEKKSKK